jgi:hypothetical protein
MKYFFDTEFIEDGKTIDLISIGIVSEDGRELYCVNQDAKLHLASDWVRQNVLPHLPNYCDPAWISHADIKDKVRQFIVEPYYLSDPNGRAKIEMWAYYADYDWVAFCQLFGTMMDLPSCMPKFCMDLKQLSVMVGSPKHPEQTSTEHNALEDARWNKELYYFLQGIKS